MKQVFGFIIWTVVIAAISALFIGARQVSGEFAGYRSYLIQSGSMEPSIMTGDIILISANETYGKNDVITFLDSQERTVTHRIMDISANKGQNHYVTKGDANRSEDEDFVPHDRIIGKVRLVIPKLGYMVGFAKSANGILLLIVVPAVILLLSEFVAIVRRNGSN